LEGIQPKDDDFKVNRIYLAVEGNAAVHKRESSFWLSKGVSSVRVLSMNEAIEKVLSNHFLFVGINSDNVIYKPKLKLLCDVTSDPIFIATSLYSKQEHAEASSLGAELFGEVFDTPEGNYQALTDKLNQLNERSRQSMPIPELILSRNILISQTHRQVFFDDQEIKLTKIDFDILYLLMSNRKHVLSPEQIYSHAWEDRGDASVDNSVRSAIKRLRKKIAGLVNDDCIIENVRGVGYRFTG